MFKVVIGLEVHCELDTKSKNFSAAPNKFSTIPNENVATVDANGVVPSHKGGRFMKVINGIVLALIVIGAINWGLVGIFNFNLVDYIFGNGSVMSRIIYIVVAISGLINVVLYFVDLDNPGNVERIKNYLAINGAKE